MPIKTRRLILTWLTAVLQPKKRTILLFAGAAFAGVGYLLYESGILDLFLNKDSLLEFIRLHRKYAAFIFIGLQAMQVVAAPVPGEVTGFVGGLIFGPVRGIVYSTIGLTIGSWLAFALARTLGLPLVEKLVSPETIARYDYVMRRGGRSLVFFMFLIPGFPKDYLCYLLGLGHMRQRDFLIVSFFGRLLGTVLLTMEGVYFRSEQYGAFLTVLGIGLGATLIAMIYRERLERWLRHIRERNGK